MFEVCVAFLLEAKGPQQISTGVETEELWWAVKKLIMTWQEGNFISVISARFNAVSKAFAECKCSATRVNAGTFGTVDLNVTATAGAPKQMYATELTKSCLRLYEGSRYEQENLNEEGFSCN